MKAAICYLIKSDNNTYNLFKKSLQHLYKNFNYKFEYPIRVFVEKSFDANIKKEIELLYKNISFFEIRFKNVDISVIKDKSGYGMSTRHMDNFMFYDILNYVDDLDWYMRLDADSFINSEINYDVFDFLERNNKVYGYIAELLEHPSVCIGMDKLFIKLKNEMKIKPPFLDFLLDNNEAYKLRQIYNNFEIKNISFLKSKNIKNVINKIIESNGIYEYRWGDAPLMTFLLSLFVSRESIHRFVDIDYTHQFFNQTNKKVECIYTPVEWIKNNEWIALNN